MDTLYNIVTTDIKFKSEAEKMGIEKKVEADRLSGTEITQLTDYRGHSHHLYFTNPGWYDEGRRMLFASERNNCNNLYGIELATGEIEQLTVFDDAERGFLTCCVNPRKDEAYFREKDTLFSLNLNNRELNGIYYFDPDWHMHMMSVSADGRFVYFSVFSDPGEKISYGVQRGEISFEEVWRQSPLSRIIRVPCDGGAHEIVHEEKRWLAHVNTSPTHPELLTFCYEGPWDKVGQRIWLLNVESMRISPVRPVKSGETVGHEYWYADGVRIGYHGHSDGGMPFFGHVRFDQPGRNDNALQKGGETGHIFSLDDKLVVGDGDGVIKLWKLEDGHYAKPRVLCSHRSGMRIQKTHPHPRLTPDGGSVIFTSDRSGYGNIYMAPVVDFYSLKEYIS